MSETREADLGQPLQRPCRRLIYRHSRITRLTHWINLLCVTVLLMSGLQIFNAHPALYWVQFGADADQPLFDIGAADSGEGPPVGFTRIGSSSFQTTGIPGVSSNVAGDPVERGFPRWVTLPSWRDLGMGRRWHFFFAWLYRREPHSLSRRRNCQRTSAARSPQAAAAATVPAEGTLSTTFG
jgi:Prokaryotic cytochrome b561